jgi:phospholipase/lecithinase/hemolysin
VVLKESALTKELDTFVVSVVDGIALSIVRLNAVGIRHIVVTNLPYMKCIPLSINELAYTDCSTNSSVVNQTSLHNMFLYERVKGLNKQLPSLRAIIADQTKAFKELISYPAIYGTHHFHAKSTISN